MTRGKQTCRILKEIRRPLIIILLGLFGGMTLEAKCIDSSSYSVAEPIKSIVSETPDSVSTARKIPHEKTDDSNETLILITSDDSVTDPSGDTQNMAILHLSM